MIRTDGKFVIYIIKSNYQRKDKWSNAGDCGGWFRDKDTKAQQAIFRKRQEPFTACGDCWQETGIHGTYNQLEAHDFVAFLQSRWREHEFAVFELNIEQETVRC